MHIIETQQQELQHWIAAIYKDEHAATEYLKQLPEAVHQQLQMHIQDIDFPVYIIERMIDNQKEFSFTNHNGLVEQIRAQKKNLPKDDAYVYFTFYMIEADYFQKDVYKSEMNALEHTNVTNIFLYEERISYSDNYDTIQALVSNYDIDGLDAMYEKFMQGNTSDYEKYELATEGYMIIYWQMMYDFACEKLSGFSIDSFLHLIEQSEKLSGNKYWNARAEAHLTILEHSININGSAIPEPYQKAVEALEVFAKEEPLQIQDAYQKIAIAHNHIAQVIPEKREIYLRDAILILKKSIELDPEKGDWDFLLRLLYLPIPISTEKTTEEVIFPAENTLQLNKYSGKELSDCQIEFQTALPLLMQQYEQCNIKMPYVYALAYYNLRSHLTMYNLEMIDFPQDAYFYWLDEAVYWNPETITRIDLSEVCQFFKKEGVRLNRMDLLMKVISFYERMIPKIDVPAFELYYIAQAWESIAHIHLSNGAQKEADAAITKVIDLYKSNLDIIRCNYSTHSHYLDFLEYCYLYKGNIEKPSLETLYTVCDQVEDEAEGYHSTPIFLHMRLALLENKEDEAIHHLTRSLILHELCIDNQIEELIETYRDSTFHKLFAFLVETDLFMKAARPNYYFDPELKWDVLKTMQPDAVRVYWEQRKNVILKREPMDWSNN